MKGSGMNLNLSSNPNAAVALASGSGLGELVILLFNHVFHWSLTPEQAVPIAGAVAAGVLFLGKNGLKGVWKIIWGGTATK
jgi:hypothetical protein